MNGLEFIASVIASLAWPFAAVVLALAFRRSLSTLIADLSKLRYKSLELDFERKIEEITESAREIDLIPEHSEALPRLPPGELAASGKTKDVLANASRVSGEFPSAAIAMAWSAVLDELILLANKSGQRPIGHPAHLIQDLTSRKLLPFELERVLLEMVELRDLIVHRPQEAGRISPEKASEYVVVAKAVRDQLASVSPVAN